MKRTCLSFLSLLLILGLSACGPTPQEAAADPLYALSTHVDLEGVSPETLNTICDTVDMTSEDKGVTVDLRSVLGDGHVMYASFVVHYPDTVSSEDAMGTTLAVDPVWGDPTQTPELNYIPYTALNCEHEKAVGGGISYMVSWNTMEDMRGKQVSLVISGDNLCGSRHTFTWAVEDDFVVRTAELADKNGTVWGTAQLSPFSLVLTPNEDAFSTIFYITENLRLTNTDGTNRPVALPYQQSQDGITTLLADAISATHSQWEETTFLFFSSPLEVEDYVSISLDTYRADF